MLESHRFLLREIENRKILNREMKFTLALLAGANALHKMELRPVENGEFPDSRSELFNFYDIQYIANITLGSPAQDLTVLLETFFIIAPDFRERLRKKRSKTRILRTFGFLRRSASIRSALDLLA